MFPIFIFVKSHRPVFLFSLEREERNREKILVITLFFVDVMMRIIIVISYQLTSKPVCWILVELAVLVSMGNKSALEVNQEMRLQTRERDQTWSLVHYTRNIHYYYHSQHNHIHPQKIPTKQWSRTTFHVDVGNVV